MAFLRFEDGFSVQAGAAIGIYDTDTRRTSVIFELLAQSRVVAFFWTATEHHIIRDGRIRRDSREGIGWAGVCLCRYEQSSLSLSRATSTDPILA